jgi:hypothetical protein
VGELKEKSMMLRTVSNGEFQKEIMFERDNKFERESQVRMFKGKLKKKSQFRFSQLEKNIEKH